MMMPLNMYVCVAWNQRSNNSYICDWLEVGHDCHIPRIRNIDKNLLRFQHSPCDDNLDESYDGSGFDVSGQNIVIGLHCFITRQEQSRFTLVVIAVRSELLHVLSSFYLTIQIVFELFVTEITSSKQLSPNELRISFVENVLNGTDKGGCCLSPC